MHPAAAPLATILRLDTLLFHACLEGMDDEAARRRPTPATNSAAFVAVHLVDSRHYLARLLGAEPTNPFAGLLEGVESIDELSTLPSLDEVRRAWDDVSATLDVRLESVTDEELRAPSPQRFPVDDPTVGGALAFLAQHDAYHVGQLSLLRKYLGLPAMRYP